MSNPSVAAKYQVLQISKNGRSFPLQSKVTSFDYYESLLSPNITATMSFVDSGLVEDPTNRRPADMQDRSTYRFRATMQKCLGHSIPILYGIMSTRTPM